MNFIIPEIDFDTASKSLIQAGFGVDDSRDGTYAEVWTDNNYEGTGMIGGFKVGVISRGLGSFGSICRLEMTDFNIGREEGRPKLIELFTILINRTTIR